MIAKAIKGKGFRGALEYDLKEEQGHIIDTDMDGCSPHELPADFGEIHSDTSSTILLVSERMLSDEQCLQQQLGD